METALVWLGFFVLASVCIVAVGLTLSFLIYQAKEFYDRLVYRIEALARRDIGNELISSSNWYSEDRSTQTALQIIGRNLSKNGYASTSDARGEWRALTGRKS